MNSEDGITDEASALIEYPVVIEVPVWWGDQDAFGHVNNTVYLRWFESARIAYLERVGLSGPSAEEPLGPILASIACQYRRPLHYPDRVRVGARIGRIGRSSLTMNHAVWSVALGAIAADGVSTLVAYDYRAGAARAVPEAIRGAIESLEGRELSP